MNELKRSGLDHAYVALNWDGEVRLVTPHLGPERFLHDFRTPMVKALLYLGLLNPEIEMELQVSLSEHQKLGWLMEYQQRIGYETVNWKLEAKRLKAAFDLEADCEFIDKSEEGKVWRELVQTGTEQPCTASNKFDLSVRYSPQSRHFHLKDSEQLLAEKSVPTIGYMTPDGDFIDDSSWFAINRG